MGLLDDAIREHLELQRRRGADPSEIERSEREALGPVRRAPEGAPEELEPAEFEADDGADQADDYEAEYGYEEGAEHESEYSEGEAAPAPREGELYDAELPEYEPPGHDPLPHTHEPEPSAHDEPPAYEEPPGYDEPPARHEPREHDEAFADEPPAYEPPPPADEPPAHEPPPPHRAPEAEHPDQETVEYELEDHPEAAQGEHAEGEDVLEETPEFLQDTPEHDRLWFEQRPPRDFDFDG
jgi:hypothetical protein